jgi:AcrR family transcriptional regulator
VLPLSVMVSSDRMTLRRGTPCRGSCAGFFDAMSTPELDLSGMPRKGVGQSRPATENGSRAPAPDGHRSTDSRNGSSSAAATRRDEILWAANSVIARSGLRTSLEDIADAAGILAGSLYFHFASKDDLLLELVARYHAELQRIGEIAVHRLDERHPRPVLEQIVQLGCEIARTAVEHRAALQLSFYEGPGSDPEIQRPRQRPDAIQQAMQQVLRAGRWSGHLRADVDIAVLADRICQSMLYVGLDYIRHQSTSDDVATLLCRILLHGVATNPPTDSTLDASAAMAAAKSFVASWPEAGAATSDHKLAHIRAVARTEFARRGYESTTVRDIAAASGLGQSTVYRLAQSKENLLMSIMQSFGERVGNGWTGVLRSDSSPVEKLDALSWLNVCAVDQFPDEFRIQLAWLRQAPPNTATPGWSFGDRIRDMKALLTEGMRTGEIFLKGPSPEVLARSVIGLHWVPENILRDLGTRESLMHLRDTVLRGVANREPRPLPH